MKKWYFSNNGEISGPMDLTSAKKVVEKNSELYGWHPSFTSWKPVCVIGEFTDVIKISKVISQVPKEIINEFNNKKIALSEKLILVNENIKETEVIKAKLKKKITLYKHLTEDLSDDFQSAIISIEQQYSAFSKRLLNLQDAANIADNEIEQITQKFQDQVSNKQDNVEEFTSNVHQLSADDVVDDSETVIDIDADFDLVGETVHLSEADFTKEISIEESNAKENVIEVANIQICDVETKIVEDKGNKEENDKEKTSPIIKKISTVSESIKPEPASPTIKRMVIDTKAPDTVRQPIRINTQEHSEQSIRAPEVSKNEEEAVSSKITLSANNDVEVSKITSIDNSEIPAKKGLAGVKGMFKSVFKSQEAAPKLSAQLKMSEAIKATDKESIQSSVHDETGEVVELRKAVNESEVLSDVGDEESDATKKARRRRRRR